MNALNTNLKPRRNYWLLTERIVGCILLLWSMFVLYSILSIIADMFRSGYIAAGNTSFSSIVIKNHLIVIISILCLYGSWALLYNDKTGWMLCVVSSLIYCINLFMSSQSKAIDSKLPFVEHHKSYGIASLLFLLIFFLLLLKPMRIKYRPTVKTWILISVAIVLCILDKIIFHAIEAA
jgi:hypothetical protein